MALKVFTPACRALWAILAGVAILVGTAPVPAMPRYAFYGYCALNALLFVALGYLVPLTFSSFYALNRGIAFTAVSVMLIEALQAMIGPGHSFHWYELIVKLFLILFGFALALNARYDHRMSWGPLQIRLEYS